MKSGGFDQLAGQLFAASESLQVTPRRRLFGTNNVSVPAGSSATVVTLTNFTADIIQPNDGLLFDLLLAVATAGAAPGVTLSSLAVSLDGPTFAGLPLPNQPVFTQSAISAAANFQANMTPSPALLSSFDLYFLGQFPPAIQPGPALVPTTVRLRATGVFANSSAAAIVAVLELFALLRIVRGLQEG